VRLRTVELFKIFILAAQSFFSLHGPVRTLWYQDTFNVSNVIDVIVLGVMLGRLWDKHITILLEI